MDYNKTLEQYQKYGMEKKFESLPEYSRYKKEIGFFEKVKSQRNGGEYLQAEDLIKRELVPENWTPPRVDSKGKAVKYPYKEIWEIYRIKAVNSSEWMKSRFMIYGLDSLGNELNLAVLDSEMFNEVIPVYDLKPENPKDNPRFKDTKMVRVIDRVETRKKYTEPFNPETVQKLYDGPKYEGKCNLVVINESSDHPGFGNIPLEHFKSMPFDELWEMLTTPKFKMDRSYGDNLNNSHIG
jgi:hypothetical protein